MYDNFYDFRLKKLYYFSFLFQVQLHHWVQRDVPLRTTRTRSYLVPIRLLDLTIPLGRAQRAIAATKAVNWVHGFSIDDLFLVSADNTHPTNWPDVSNSSNIHHHAMIKNTYLFTTKKTSCTIVVNWSSFIVIQSPGQISAIQSKFTCFGLILLQTSIMSSISHDICSCI